MKLMVGKWFFVVAASALAIAPAILPAAEVSEDRGAMGLSQALKRLNVVASVLHTGAHPDDENSALLAWLARGQRSEEHTSELQSQSNLVCRLLLEKKKYK